MFYIILHIILHIVCYDIWFYISHVVLHMAQIYELHKIHHSTPVNKLNYTSTHVAHHVENFVQLLGVFIPCFIFGCDLIALIISFILIGIRGLMRHDHRCSWLIGNHHILHHKYIKYNFGEYWIDYLCGTILPNKNEYVYGKIYT